MERAGRIFVIRPSEPLTIARTSSSPEELQTVYEIGRKDALEKLEALQSWLG